ncbi:uncharacterized protein LOC111333242 [Stylophora pistillata]|uniref:uncharacterized protein LOC111333242 n=1 Tax=Stylophora pistillata TaxID=50429 RepID=UPI000C03D605|nr:uncharacterized protein LOC111333242 [Stylophora pistillata]
MRDKKAPCRFTDDLEHYLVVFKEDDIKKIFGAEELRKCGERVKGASCEALWKDSNHTDWYPAFIVDIGDLEYLKSVQLGRQKLQKVQKKKLPAASSTNKKAAVSAKKRKRPAVQKLQDVESECEDEQKRRKTLNNDAKAKKAANAKALKEALLKRRLEQAKVFDIPPNDNYDSDIECTSSNNMHVNQEKEYLCTVRQVITYTGSKDKRKPKESGI